MRHECDRRALQEFDLFKIMAKSIACSTVLLLAIISHVTLASKLNVARVLLPIFDDISTNFTLVSTENTCLKWSATREDVVKLTALDPFPETGCSTSMVVSAISKDRNKVSVDIFAEDAITQQSLRAVVILDVIHSLDIVTKTRELLLEEAPEIFEVRAYDSQGNEFSTLSGVPLTWSIVPVGSSLDAPVVKLTPFRESSYETPPSLIDLEERGLWGDKVLLEGFKTGLSKVSVKLNQKEYESVKSNEIMLSVVANLMILPPEVYIIEGDVVRFRIIQTSYGKMQEVNMKTSQYYLKVESADIAQIQWDPNMVKGSKLGQTKIFLNDKNMDKTFGEDLRMPKPSATVNVVRPAYLQLNLLPHRNWVTVVKEPHEIVADLFTENDQKIILGDDFHIQTTIAEGFHVQERSANGSWHFGWTENGAACIPVSAVLDSVSPPLQTNAEILVFPRIAVAPSDVILPWDSAVKPKFDVDFQASGGDGKFLWSSSNNSIGVVTQLGQVHTHNMGTFEVAAAMQRNHNIRQTAKLFILPPTKLEIVDYVTEAEVGTTINVHVALYVHKPSPNGNQELSPVPVTRCQELEFNVRTTDPRFMQQKGPGVDPIGTACGNIAITSLDAGTTKVTISYTIGDVQLQDSVSLTFFLPLKVLQPTGVIVLAVGSSTNIIFTGGPKHGATAQNTEISSTGAGYVKTSDVTEKHKMPQDGQYFVLHVLCQKLGASNVSVSVSNPSTLPISKNQKSTSTVTVVCGKPRKLEIQPAIKVPDVTSCPMDLSAQRVVVENDQEINLFVRVLDDEGREFLNVSSLQFQFETRGDAHIGAPKNVYEVVGVIGNAVYANKSTQKITPKMDSGEIVFVGSITGYNKNVLRLNKVTAEQPPFLAADDPRPSIVPINATISMLLVDDTVVTPDEVTIYNHPKNRILLDVHHGSGFYSVALTRDDVVDVKYVDSVRKLGIQPLSVGDVSIKLIDLCLLNKPAQINVNVVSISSIHVHMSDKIQLGKCITCIITLLDKEHRPLDIPNMDLIEMSHSMGTQLASVERMTKPTMELTAGQLQYVLTGIELGDTSLMFFIGDPDYEGYVASSPLPLQVFPPLRIMPRTMVIMQGAVVQFTVTGGPQPTSDMEFNADNENTALICHHGVVTGVNVGTTKVMARAVAVSPTGQRIIYSEDTAEVQVIALTSVYVSAPATKVMVGAVVPLWASAKPEQISPLILATMKPSIVYSWLVRDAHIARIYDIVEDKKVDGPSTNLPFVRLRGLATGKTQIFLNATVMKGKKTVVYASSLEVDVVVPLELRKPETIDGKLLKIAPNAYAQLSTNFEEENCDVTYRMMGAVASSTEVQQKTASPPALTVNREGLLRAGYQLGMGIVIASAIDSLGSRQNLIIPIEVKNIHYMMLSLSSRWQSSQTSYQIPLGVDMELRVTFYDNLGHKLIASSNEATLKLSRQNLVSVHRKSNDTFTISTKKSGITVLQLITETDDRITDFIRLNVTQLITPHDDQVVVGDVLWYNTPVRIADEVGQWSSSDTSIVNIDAVTGIAIARAPGKVTVFHSFHQAAPIQITVLPISDIALDAQNASFTSSAEFKLYVALRSMEIPRTHNLLVDHELGHGQYPDIPSILDCSLSFEDATISPSLFNVDTKFDLVTGKHYCSVKYRAGSGNETYALPKSNAYIRVEVLGSDLPPTQFQLCFAPGIHIPDEVAIDSRTYTGELVLYGPPEALQSTVVTANDENLLHVGDRSEDAYKATYSLELVKKDGHMYNERIYLDVNSASSNQQHRVKVVMANTFTGGKCSEQRSSLLTVLHDNRVIVSVILGTVLMITVCSYAYINHIQPPRAINVNVVPLTEGHSSHNISNLDSSRSSDNCYCTRSPEIRRNRRYM